MTWPNAVEDCWPDDHTAESRRLYEQLRREAQVPVPEPKPEWFAEGATAAALERHSAQRYLYPRRPSRARRVA